MKIVGRDVDLAVSIERWPTRSPFRIAGHEISEAVVVVAVLCQGMCRGRGEASGVYYRGETADDAAEQIEAVGSAIRAGLDREALQSFLPPGGARNALDCAFWELEAQRVGEPVWRLAGLDAPRPLRTVFTIGIDDPGKMSAAAAKLGVAHALKLKLAGDEEDADRVRAVRAVRPDAWLAVDANQGFTPAEFAALLPVLIENRVGLIEQPLAIGREAAMRDIASPIPVAADESVQDIADLEALVGLFDVINIKLDKCGGLTAALAMEMAARRLGFSVMVGNMTGTSWAQAPGYLLGQRCDYVDLDGPTLLQEDRSPGVRYVDGRIICPAAVWGDP